MSEAMALEILADKPQEMTRRASDVAGLCRDIVIKTACSIQGRKYVKVEGWMAIATAHGTVASCRDVERVEGGFRAIGEIRRIADGQVLATAEGFVGEDEPTWFGGVSAQGKTLPKRADYAIRAMCQTRAISRVCRSCFSHVVVLMDAGLSTTPAEEVPDGGLPKDNDADASGSSQQDQSQRYAKGKHSPPPYDTRKRPAHSPDGTPAQRTLMLTALKDIEQDLFVYAVDRGIIMDTEALEDWPLDKVVTGIGIEALRKAVGVWKRQQDSGGSAPAESKDDGWRGVVVHFGKNKDVPLGGLEDKSLRWYVLDWQPKPYKGKISDEDTKLRAALDEAQSELGIVD